MKPPPLAYTSLEEERTLNSLPVKGKFPEWLSGILLRNGPAKFEVGSRPLHWLDGLAMLHAFSFQGGQVSYTNRFLRSAHYKRIMKDGKLPYRTFASDPCKRLFRHFFSLFYSIKDLVLVPQNCNVNLKKIAANFVAMTEVPLSIRFDPKTLETLGVFDYEDHLCHHLRFESAHPHKDFIHREELNYYTSYGRKSEYILFSCPENRINRHLISKIPAKRPSYMHSFAITEHYIVLTEFPFVINPLQLLLKRRPFIENFRWQPELGTRFIVIERHSGKIREIFETGPFFAFHHVNAYEERDRIILDLITYPDPYFITQPEHDMLLNSLKQLTRFELSFSERKITHRSLTDLSFEMPHIYYEKHNGNEYQFVYGVGSRGELVKVDTQSGKHWSWEQDECYAGEPVFVAEPYSKNEVKGVILSVILDQRRGISFLLVLRASDFTEIARAELPHHIPFGLHGKYFDRELLPH